MTQDEWAYDAYEQYYERQRTNEYEDEQNFKANQMIRQMQRKSTQQGVATPHHGGGGKGGGQGSRGDTVQSLWSEGITLEDVWCGRAPGDDRSASPTSRRLNGPSAASHRSSGEELEFITTGELRDYGAAANHGLKSDASGDPPPMYDKKSVDMVPSWSTAGWEIQDKKSAELKYSREINSEWDL